MVSLTNLTHRIAFIVVSACPKESSIRSVIAVALSGVVMSGIMYSLQGALDVSGLSQQPPQ